MLSVRVSPSLWQSMFTLTGREHLDTSIGGSVTFADLDETIRPEMICLNLLCCWPSQHDNKIYRHSESHYGCSARVHLLMSLCMASWVHGWMQNIAYGCPDWMLNVPYGHPIWTFICTMHPYGASIWRTQPYWLTDWWGASIWINATVWGIHVDQNVSRLPWSLWMNWPIPSIQTDNLTPTAYL